MLRSTSRNTAAHIHAFRHGNAWMKACAITGDTHHIILTKMETCDRSGLEACRCSPLRDKDLTRFACFQVFDVSLTKITSCAHQVRAQIRYTNHYVMGICLKGPDESLCKRSAMLLDPLTCPR